jgi:hypothetical protein
MYRAACSQATLTYASLKTTYDGADIGETAANSWGRTVEGNFDHWNSTEMTGFKVVDCNGSSSFDVLAKVLVGGSGVNVGSQQVISLPLEGWGLVENTDYWNHQDESVFTILSPVAQGPQVTTDTLNFTAPVTGQYLCLWSCEANLPEEFGNSYSIDAYFNGARSTQGDTREGITAGPSTEPDVGEYHTFMWSDIRTFTAGANNVEIRGQIKNSWLADMLIRRRRMIVIDLSAFEGTPQTASVTDPNTVTTSTFTEMPDYSLTHTSASDEQVLVLLSLNTQDFTVPSVIGTFKIRDDTEGVDYATDFGERQIEPHTEQINTIGFGLKEATAGDTDWKAYIRCITYNGSQVRANSGTICILGLKPV